MSQKPASRVVNGEPSEASDGRKPASKSYVQLLRDRIALLERILRSHSIDVDAAVAQLQAEEIDSLLLEANGHNAATSQAEEICTAFEGTLSLDESINFDQDGEVRYFGPTSGRLGFQDLKDASCDNYLFPRNGSCSKGCNGRLLYSSKAHLNSTVLEVDADLQAELIDLYFTWQNPWFPVLDESLFRSNQQQDHGRFSNPLLLNCVLAAGSRFSDRLELRTDPDDAKTAGARFLEEAEILLHYDLKSPNFATIQAVSIMVMVYCSHGADAAAWLHQGTAHRLALDMGLNFDPTSVAGPTCLSVKEANLRRQIYWSLYCMDKLHATYSGRVCTMLEVQGSVKLPSYNANYATNNGSCLRSERTLALLSAHVTQSRILERVLLAFYAPQPSHTGSRREPFFHANLVELKNWFYDLPDELRLESGNQANTFPQAYTLHMAFHTTLILLGNAMLASNARAAPVPDMNTELSSKKASCVCYEAATNICITAKKYRHVFGSFLRSPISATHCLLSAALVLIQVASAENEVNGRRATVANIDLCLQSLDELSTCWSPAGRIHRNLTSFRVQKLGEYGRTTSKKQTTSSQRSYTSDSDVQAALNKSSYTEDSFLADDSIGEQKIMSAFMLDDTHICLEASTNDADLVHGFQFLAEPLSPVWFDTTSWGTYSMDLKDCSLK
ncbi:hypothetical protein EKO04_000603 [Ascochyta lentis]|uniref:Xylanolytic transcriptional activator regulatory domain-containing protein n=1 Tax=Ascochyta lentis TaxID=205686 RepID=A0A8H7JBG7_9PLEO|nr:hypothetical protein EKO04_000603 [Ascochyta lentis]